jgi:ABC-type phosphate transport system substrate-binding protein
VRSPSDRKALLLALALAAPLAFAADVPVDSFVVVVHESNPAKSMAERSIAEVFLSRHVAWANHEPITIVLQERDRALTEAFCQAVLGLTPEQLEARILQAKYKGAEQVAVQRVQSDAAARAYVTAHPGAIAYLRPGPVAPPLKTVFTKAP